MNKQPDPNGGAYFLERGEWDKRRPVTAAERARAERRASIRREPLPPQGYGTGTSRPIK